MSKDRAKKVVKRTPAISTCTRRASESRPLTDAELDELGGYLLGTCSSIVSGLRALGRMDLAPDEDDIENRLLDISVERCRSCSWWSESCELDGGDDGEVGYHDDCQPERA